jgi:hypothetical protein
MLELRCIARETVSGRQQSCWQHPGGAWNWASWDGRPCIGFRRQHACGGAAETARATGANTPTSSRTSNNLAVTRCMSFEYYLDGPTRNRLQREKQFTGKCEIKDHKIVKSLVIPSLPHALP